MPEGKVAASAQRPPREAEQSGQTVDEQHRATLIGRVITIGLVVAAITVGRDVLLYSQTGAWQALAAGGGVLLAVACLLPALISLRRGRLTAAASWILVGLAISYGSGELVTEGLTGYIATGGILMILLVGIVLLPRKWGVWVSIAGLFGMYVWLVNRFEPLPRYDISQTGMVRTYITGTMALLALAILWQIIRAIHIGTIRTRLLVAFVALTLLVATTIGAVAVVMGYRSGQEQVIAQLESVAALKEAEIETWVDTLQTELGTMLTGANAEQYTRILLQEESPDPADYQEAHDKLQGRFQKSLNWLEETFMMDLKGHVVLSSDATQEGKIHDREAYFDVGARHTAGARPARRGSGRPGRACQYGHPEQDHARAGWVGTDGRDLPGRHQPRHADRVALR
jgi:cell division protein FtsL